jgi:hypothetical protein
MPKDGGIVRGIKNCRNYIYQFHYTEMYLRSPWKSPTEPQGSAEHSLNTSILGHSLAIRGHILPSTCLKMQDDKVA